MASKKIRQPLVSIGALNLWKLALSAAEDVMNGDDSDPYVKEIRFLSDKAAAIAKRALDRKGIKTQVAGT